MNIKIPKLSLVVLMGTSGSGKSTFAKQHFLETEVLSSDACRGWVSDDPNNQAVSKDAFDVLEFVARKRLAAGRLTVIDATNLRPEARRQWVRLAREYHVLPVIVALKIDKKVCAARNRDRPDRSFGRHVLDRQYSLFRRSQRGLKKEGFRHVFMLDSVEKVDAVEITRVKLWNDRKDEHGPFDFIGDVHGCADELQALLDQLGYVPVAVEKEPGWSPLCYQHPEGRKAAFVGDLVDRGPRALDVLSITRNMVEHGSAICVPGNHDAKLLRKLSGRQVKIQHGLAETLADLESVPNDEKDAFTASLIQFLDGLVSHYVLDDGKVVMAHAGMREEMQGRGSGKVRSFALYGETTGETDQFGLPVRFNWAAEYRGDAMVVYGHTPIPKPEWLNKTINIDTGCVFGGSLTAMRYPEQELVSVPANKTYCEPAKPIESNRYLGLSSQQISDDLLDADDVIGKRVISTRLRRNITVREENATAALESISRFAVDPKWLIYLPPTMSPAETSREPGFLEHPSQALGYFRSQGVKRVVCQEKHMGSRAVVVVCRDAAAAKERFGVTTGETGIVYTRTGRRFFKDLELEAAFMSRIGAAMSAAGFWDQFDTSWACLDCELMPWSAKAQELLQAQYAAVGAAASAAVPKSIAALRQAQVRLAEINSDEAGKLESVSNRMTTTIDNTNRFRAAYRQYCWPVSGLEDYRLAPFHILATEGKVHVDRDHRWHLEQIAKVCDHDEILMATKVKEVDLEDEAEVAEAIDWWMSMTESGGEGMVVKPFDFIHQATRKRRKKNLGMESGSLPEDESLAGKSESDALASDVGPVEILQPAVKCRGKEYLRIIYGPNYDEENNLKRLRERGLGRKRSLAIREFALGVESLERFVAGDPLRRTHECVFGVLALESEPVDPRL